MSDLRRHQAQARTVDAKGMKLRPAQPGDFGTLIEQPTLVTDQAGAPLIAYLDLAQEPEGYPADLLAAIRAMRFDTSFRTNGLKTTSRVFGYQPRITIRRDFCTATSVGREHPAENAVLHRWAALLSGIYARVNPERHARQEGLLAGVRPEWRIPGSVFTSGIVNENNPLSYHTDAGNFPGVWSCMVALTRDIEGGYLSVPELDLGFAFRGASLIAFDGARLLHGVTPIRRKSAAAYRYTAVFYALKGMCDCLSPADELARIRRVKTGRESARKRGAP